MPRTPSPDDLPLIGLARAAAEEEARAAEAAAAARADAEALARSQAQALSASERMEALARLLSDAETAEDELNGRSAASARDFDAVMRNLSHFLETDVPGASAGTASGTVAADSAPDSIDPEGGTPV